MTTTTTTTIPIACVPGAIPAAERAGHFALLARLFGTEMRERRPIDDGDAEGYSHRFDAGALLDLARWVEHERRCCPFLTFALEITPDGGPIWVRLTGPAGTRAFLDAEMAP